MSAFRFDLGKILQFENAKAYDSIHYDFQKIDFTDFLFIYLFLFIFFFLGGGGVGGYPDYDTEKCAKMLSVRMEPGTSCLLAKRSQKHRTIWHTFKVNLVGPKSVFVFELGLIPSYFSIHIGQALIRCHFF